MVSIWTGDEDVKKLGLVVDGSGRGGRRRGDMEKNELSEGKSFFGRDDDIDPDALSYIDEKIKHVLGHFQKEFEGGVSAESLGAKFGGYGSFLPAYQRSPSILSLPKSPVMIPNHNVSRSPNNLQPQDGHQCPSVIETTPITKVSIASEGQLTEKSGKGKASIITHRSESISQSLIKPVNICDQKMLKVRIKVGHDDDLPRNKPDIYSDLGLDVSPSPSLEDTPDGSEECSPESPDAFLESPTTILQIMTCFSVPGGYILSPLPDSLQHSNGKEDIFLMNFKTGVLHKGQTEACPASSDASLNLKYVNGSTCKKIKAGDKSQMLRETDGLTCKGDMRTFLKKETEAETPVAQKVSYNAPDMSNSSRARCGDAKEDRQIGSSAKEIYNSAGNFKDPDKVSLKERIPISNLSTDNLIGFAESMRNDFAGISVKEDIHSNGDVNSKSSLTIKSFEERIGNNQDTSSKPAERGGKALKIYNTTKADSRRYNSGRKNHSTEHEKPANHNPAQKAASCEKDVLMTIQEIDRAYEGGSVPKGSPTNDEPCAEPSKENLSISSFVAPKEKNEMCYESNLKAHKLQKKAKKGKAKASHEGFGVSTHIQKVDENKHTFGSSRFIENSKVKLGLHKVDNLQIANSANDALAVAPPAISASVIKDNWVFCDLCQTWRLLPYETNPDNLPKKWQCSMQVWLPGLNKCYISEDETTKAFHRLYQVLAPGTDLSVHPDAAVSGITSDVILNHNGRLENNACSIPSGVKKKHGLMDASKLPNGLSISGKNLQASSENRSLYDVIRNSLEMDSSNKRRIGQTSRSADLTMEKHNHKVEEKPSKIKASCPDEGDLFGKGDKNSRSKSRRQVDLDGHRSSKKIKKDGLHYSKKDLHTEDEIVGKMTINGDCDLPPRASRKVLQSSGAHSASKDFKTKAAPAKNPNESIGAFSNGEHKEHVNASDTEKLAKYDSKDKKRGVKELQESGTHRKNSMTSQQLVENRLMIKDGSSESELRRQKKAKVAKSEGQDSSAVIVDGKTDKKGCLTRIKLSSSQKYLPDKVDDGSMHAFECVDGMKRDVTNVQLVTADTSSSSKVSGSQISRVNLQEAIESPVESVSSSPTRMLNTQNNSTKVSLSTKDDILSIGPSLKGSPKSIYNGDVDASDQSGTMTLDPASKTCLRISKNSKVAEPGVLDSLSASHDNQGKNANCFSVEKTGDVMYLKRGTHDDFLCDDFGRANVVYDDENASNQLTKYPVEKSDKNHTCYQNDSGHQKLVKCSSHCRESKKDSTFGANKGKPKTLDWYSDHKELDHLPSNRDDNLDNYSKQHEVHDLGVTATGESYTKSISQEYLYQGSSNQKLDHSSQMIVDRSEGSSGKMIQTSHTTKVKQEKNGWCSQTVPPSGKERNLEQYHVDAVNGGASKSAKKLRKFDGLNEVHSNIFPQPSPSMPTCSPMKKDVHVTVNAFIQEARDLKHTASRLKNDGLEHESSGIFFEASLKFLHVASLMEPPNTEFVRQGELFPSVQMLKMYVDTAMFCEFCAREYENLKEMAAAALAYKCAEVAYMKVAYFRHPSASKDRHELQAALDAALPGESPSSSASDVDILNNQGGFEKAASARATCSPQLATNFVIAARNRSYVKRLLTYTNYLNCAFEAANKSRNAIAAASIDLDKDRVESVCSVRKVLDFNFNNVEGLLQLVRGSLNSISR